MIIACDILPAYFFKVSREKPRGEKSGSLVEADTAEKEPDREEYILCRHCHQLITTPSERIEVQGSHQHTFANPQGIVYQIGCFRSVQGCGSAGPATEEFSWFKGFSWKIVVCTMCLTHLGWLFTSKGNKRFNGLILDRLVGS